MYRDDVVVEEEGERDREPHSKWLLARRVFFWHYSFPCCFSLRMSDAWSRPAESEDALQGATRRATEVRLP